MASAILKDMIKWTSFVSYCIYTHIYLWEHRYISTFVCTYLLIHHTDIVHHIYIHTCKQTYIHTYTHIYIHTYIYTNIHTYRLLLLLLLEALQLQRSFGLLNEFLPFGLVSDAFLPVCYFHPCYVALYIVLPSIFRSS